MDYVCISRNEDCQKSWSLPSSFLAMLAELADPAGPVKLSESNVQHAIEVFEAFSEGNYQRFFKLYLDAPLMGGYLMDFYIARERRRALQVITKTHRPTVPIGHLEQVLAFDDDAACRAR